jgi:hypothetical protein
VDRFAACFEGLEDPRSGNAALHDFHSFLIIALCTVLCGGQGGQGHSILITSGPAICQGAIEVHGVAPERIGDVADVIEPQDVEGEAA